MAWRLQTLLAAIALVVVACATGATPDELAALPDIDGIEQLTAEFNEAAGSPRLLLLLSPT